MKPDEWLEQHMADKDAEIERLRAMVRANLPGDYDQVCMDRNTARAEIERLKAQLLDILNLQHKGLTGGEWILKAHKAEEEVERLKGELEHVKFLCGPDESGKNVFEREHALKGELVRANTEWINAVGRSNTALLAAAGVEHALKWERDKLTGEMAEALLLMEQGRECLRQLVALSNVNAETRKMLRYLGNTFNLFLQKHTPPLMNPPTKPITLAETMQNVVGRAETITTWMKSHGVNPSWDGATFTFGDQKADRGDWIIRWGNRFYAQTANPIPPPLNCGSAAAGESPSHSGGGGYVGKALSGDWPTKDDALALYADEANWLGYYPPDLKPRPKIWVWQGQVLPPWEAAQNVTGKSALREVPPQEGSGVDARKSQEGSTPSLPATWRPRHMDEGDDYVNEPRTGPVLSGPPVQKEDAK